MFSGPMNGNSQISIAKIIQQRAFAKSEKRGSSRLSLRLPMDYSLPKSSSHRLAYMVDLCEGGLSMITAEKLEMAQTLRIKFFCGTGTGLDCIQTLGEVIRVERQGKAGKEYRCAVRFSDLPSEVLKELRKFLKDLY